MRVSFVICKLEFQLVNHRIREDRIGLALWVLCGLVIV